MRPVTYLVLAVAAAGIAALLFAFGPRGSQSSASDSAAPPTSAQLPAATGMGRCASCHEEIVTAYRGHGMSRSIGRADRVDAGTVSNPITKTRYEISVDSGSPLLTATTADGGVRRQRIVGRIGAGIFDTSWVGAEIDPTTGRTTERLFFAPVETVTGHGLQLSPFELHEGSPGMDQALANECLTCHTTDTPRPPPFPANDLGSDAFTRFSPLTCEACHGDVEKHADIMSGRSAGEPHGLGIARLGRRSPGEQRDVCARCHLQGDARIELVTGRPSAEHPIAAQIPVLVPHRVQTDFRFVGQLERLALSACFKNSPAMTCSTCHDPHTSAAAAPDVSRFDAACLTCHTDPAPHTTLTVAHVTGEAPRSEAGCVDCHVRRSQPFDLPHVRTSDHFIRRRIERPAMDVPHRQFSAREGEFDVYDDGRLASALRTAEGKRWRSGVLAMGLLTFGRFPEAARHFSAFPPPGSDLARTATAPPGFAPLETNTAFHTARGFALIGAGQLDAAHAAFSDAIAVDSRTAHARLARARMSVDRGDIRAAMIDTQAVIDTYPRAEQPWDLRVEIARRVNRPDLALTAADASTQLWPSNPYAWSALAASAEARGEAERARLARERVAALTGRRLERSNVNAQPRPQ
jgi:predicted CXXCH cytochrome family protein